MEEEEKMVTDNEIVVLRFLKEHPCERISRIARDLNMSRGSVSLVLKNLQIKGYINDLYEITAKGEEALELHKPMPIPTVSMKKTISIDIDNCVDLLYFHAIVYLVNCGYLSKTTNQRLVACCQRKCYSVVFEHARKYSDLFN